MKSTPTLAKRLDVKLYWTSMTEPTLTSGAEKLTFLNLSEKESLNISLDESLDVTVLPFSLLYVVTLMP